MIGRIIPYIMENQKCLKPPTSHVFIIFRRSRGATPASPRARCGHAPRAAASGVASEAGCGRGSGAPATGTQVDGQKPWEKP